MFPRIQSALHRLRRDEGGNIAILFGASAIPLLLLMGGAVDIARFSRYKADLANAVDSASLSLAKNGEGLDEEEAEEFVKNHVAALNVPVVPTTDDPNLIQSAMDQEFVVTDFDVTKQTNGFLVNADAAMKTFFLPLGGLAGGGQGMGSMGMDVTAAVVHSSNRVELALVLDNTGSMNCGATVGATCAANWSNPATDARIRAVKTAAKSLVDTLMRDNLEDADQIKIALVPFEGMVNIASAIPTLTAPPNWVAWSDQGSAKWDGRELRKQEMQQHHRHGATGPRLPLQVSHVEGFDRQMGGVRGDARRHLRAQQRRGRHCDCRQPVRAFLLARRAGQLHDRRVVRGDPLQQRQQRIEQRRHGLHVLQRLSQRQDRVHDTRGGAEVVRQVLQDGTCPSFHTGRKDVEGLLTPTNTAQQAAARDRSIRWPAEPPPTRPRSRRQIDAMIAYWATGTFIPAGLMWGWHVLSPGFPITQGTKPGDTYYDKTVKAIVLLSDGDNDVHAERNGNHNNSRGYSAWSYVDHRCARHDDAPARHHRHGRETALDTKTGTLVHERQDTQASGSIPSPSAP